MGELELMLMVNGGEVIVGGTKRLYYWQAENSWIVTYDKNRYDRQTLYKGDNLSEAIKALRK